jgi:hypothetical protein
MSETKTIGAGERSEPDMTGWKRCPTCRTSKPVSEFYAGVAECKDCKRSRSRNNRAMQARKVAAFERFVDALIVLADRTPEPPAECRRVLVSYLPPLADLDRGADGELGGAGQDAGPGTILAVRGQVTP